MALAIIGGSSLLETDVFASLKRHVVTTPHGLVGVSTGERLMFVQRHHSDPDGRYAPPHAVNQHAIVAALKAQGAARVVGFCSTGALKPEHPPGTLLVPDDYLCPWGQTTFFDDDRRGHIVPRFDADVRDAVLAALRDGGLEPRDGGVYVQTIGPRFETRAEVRMIAQFGDLVGMTGAYEATLALELGLPYAMVCMVDNFANGVADGPLTMTDFEATAARNRGTVERAVGLVVTALRPDSA